MHVKKCQKCLRFVDVLEFELMSTGNGRPRRKNTCQPCLSNKRDTTQRTVTDARDCKPDIEVAINEMVRAGRASEHADDEVRGA